MRVVDNLDLGEMDDLGRTLKAALKSYGKKIKEVAKKVGTSIKNVKVIFKQPQRLLYIIPGYGAIGYLLKRNKKLRNKVLATTVKAAPYLSAACNVLNVIIPGLGMAISLGIQTASTTIQYVQAKEAQKAMRREEEKATAEIAAANAEADRDTMAAYDKGEKYIKETYNVTRDEFKALSIEDRTRFLNLIVFDRHQKEILENLGVTRDQFIKMSIQEEIDVLATVGTSVPQAPPLGVEEQAIVGPVEIVGTKPVTVPDIVSQQATDRVRETPAADVELPAQAAAHLAPVFAGANPWVTYSLIGGGVLAAGVVVYLVARSRKA